ncbi:hypothetical protein DDB_G0280643 [Dictyostelium discoideum AX4]|uniref:Probable serine/threonine-protein kinase kinase DDB_G0280643 n=1 Tax=Dictyostelium discoideum TaxID=44689 RepID=Y9841_DICDI|nr:hypothetical protein DDB_G0280643 [Dictyostelium discoideum AX4]Q54V35.1 RecName: Full=Probable serine/threonine-protein kinase kinase DDB_G0280643 [Dictyostelium discoideum]EAL67123.1 hypothetical protein DDB_G0280643 [Dictyostelium discoideum AX4]|eukprot:XP_641096.1 hypothetical protein DDB_G0280643 [Dictyostelium discoideum AX4]
MDIYYILNHDNSDNNIFDFENNSDTIDIGKNYKKCNGQGQMLPPPTLITPSNQNDTITYYTDGRSISVPRKMLIDPNTIVDCGTNGIMFIAFNFETQKRVILKKLSKRMFDNELNGHRIIRNLIFQNLFQGGKHISTYQSIFKRKCSDSYQPPLTSILNSIISSNDNPQQHSTLIQQKDDEDFYFESIQPQYSLLNLISNNMLDQDDICQLFYEILMGLKFMHSAGVIHRDLDPENSIFVDENFNIKFTEFNNCFLLDTDPTFLFNKEYITNTYSYRAPETIWGDSLYTEATDVWGAGVLFAELLLGKRLFRSFNSKEHLKSIYKLIGAPKASEGAYVVKGELLFFLMEYNRKNSFQPTFNNTFIGCNQIQIDLLKNMLCWDPRDRYSVNEILESPYFENIHDRTNFIPCDKNLNVNIHFDILNLKPNQMTNLIDQEFLNPS